MNNIDLKQLKALVDNEKYLITLLSNTSAFLNQQLDNINWVGYYLYQDNHLVLGPFQGKVACEIIPLDKGVCGACASKKETILVKNVHEFAGHIACDSASNSEIVVPMMIDNQLYGLLDIDSPLLGRFDESDQIVLEQAVNIICTQIKKIKDI